jgi:hypothetical protein
MKIAKLSYLLLLAGSCFGTSYQVTINASSLPPATSGFIDFAFNGGYAATAVVSNFSNAGGSLSNVGLYTQGTVSGTLPGAVTLADNNADYDESIVYGTPISFFLNLSGTPSGNTGDVFTVSLFDTNYDGLLTGNVNDGWLVQFQMSPQGVITPTAYANPTGGASLATVVATPEPGTLPMAAICAAAFYGFRRLHQILQIKSSRS